MRDLQIGEPAPDFTLKSGTGEVVSLLSLRGKQVVLYFYPKDDTLACAIEACGFRDAIAPLSKTGAVVLGVSRDDQASHQRFGRKFNLPFRLLSDPDGRVARAYGAHWPMMSRLPALGRMTGVKRKTFVIDQAGRLKAVFHTVNAYGHAEEVLAVLRDRRVAVSRARVMAIDWSGAQQGAAKKIWLAEVVGGNLVRLENGRDREQLLAHLIHCAQTAEPLIVGLDFAFSFPAWFLRQRGLSHATELWSLAEREGELWLTACQSPFWGRTGTKRPEGHPLFRQTERDVPDWAQPKCVFQINGAGSVGTGSIRGMPFLLRLEQAGFSIWPFDPPGPLRILEIYPRLLTGPIAKSDGGQRQKYLWRYPKLSSDHRRTLIANEDAFDAAVSALEMAKHVDAIAQLGQVRDLPAILEGKIWHPEGSPASGEATEAGGAAGGPWPV